MRALRITGKILLVLLAILGGLTIVLAVTVGLAVNHLTRLTAAPTPAQAVLIFDLGNGVIDSLPDSPLARRRPGADRDPPGCAARPRCRGGG
jgi:hypothetical protein